MTASSLFRICLAAAMIAAAALQPNASRAQQAVNNPNIAMDLDWTIGSWRPLWRTETFASDVVDEKIGYYLYLPPGYDEDTARRYPVLYWLHGAYGRPYDASPVVRRLDAAIRAGKAPRMIVVSLLDPTGLGMWTDSKDGRLPMESMFIEDLIPHIDANWRTIAVREGRAIEGFSMGGYGAAYYGFKYYDLFSSVSILAGALHRPETLKERRRAIFDNVFGGDLDYAWARSPWRWAKENADVVGRNSSVRISVGADDGLLDWNRQFHELLAENGVAHEWGVTPKSPHDVAILMRNWEGDFFAYYRAHFARFDEEKVE